jgi:hypothetical protein
MVLPQRRAAGPAPRDGPGRERSLMSDVFFLIVTVAFAAISLLYVNACERL